jgi:hypothetical protein
MAEWLRRGLQILARRFDSGSGLHAAGLTGVGAGEYDKDPRVFAVIRAGFYRIPAVR